MKTKVKYVYLIQTFGGNILDCFDELAKAKAAQVTNSVIKMKVK